MRTGAPERAVRNEGGKSFSSFNSFEMKRVSFRFGNDIFRSRLKIVGQ